jgi:hypothetical protein
MAGIEMKILAYSPLTTVTGAGWDRCEDPGLLLTAVT